MKDLPDDVVHEILSFVGPRELCAARVVSRNWARLAERDSLWRALLISALECPVISYEEASLAVDEAGAEHGMSCMTMHRLYTIRAVGARRARPSDGFLHTPKCRRAFQVGDTLCTAYYVFDVLRVCVQQPGLTQVNFWRIVVVAIWLYLWVLSVGIPLTVEYRQRRR